MALAQQPVGLDLIRTRHVKQRDTKVKQEASRAWSGATEERRERTLTMRCRVIVVTLGVDLVQNVWGHVWSARDVVSEHGVWIRRCVRW